MYNVGDIEIQNKGTSDRIGGITGLVSASTVTIKNAYNRGKLIYEDRENSK